MRYLLDSVCNIVLELPPAPAALVLVGLAFVILSALSTAAFLLKAVLGPLSDIFRPLRTPAEAGGDEERMLAVKTGRVLALTN